VPGRSDDSAARGGLPIDFCDVIGRIRSSPSGRVPPAMEWWNKYMPLKLPELESWSFSTNLSSSALEQNATRDARNLKISDTAPSPYSSRLSHTFKKRNAPQAAPLPARRPLHSLPNGCNAATRSIFGFYFKVPPILHPRHEPQSRTDRDKPAIPV
jgi:hypothetical protein